MSTHKQIDKICVVAVVLSLLLTAVFMNGQALGIQAASKVMGYETKLFNTSEVHTIDIVMDDWDSFIETCENEEYAACSVVIDGESYKNVGIRAKGNTSLSTVSSMDSDRYSFKIEFDQYDSTRSYYGLDKLCLNNIIQDTTYMKDYLTYQMMGKFGVSAPLCSYVYITVNGEEWGLYLAVEGIEDAFLQRNYGSNYGDLYKPDSMSFGGGRGNGMNFDINEFMGNLEDTGEQSGNAGRGTQWPKRGGMPEDFNPAAVFAPSDAPETPNGFDPNAVPEWNRSEQTIPSGESTQHFEQGGSNMERMDRDERGNIPGGEMGSDDVKLKYIDDDVSSYTSIFNNAKTDITETDQLRLIESLEKLSNSEDIESVVDIDSVIRYFVIHNFVVNGDSYTGSMVHNYYLYEEDGRLSMIPWDYNLAFGTFQGSNAESAINDPIDTPLSVAGNGERPMADWIFASEEYTRRYHQYFSEFLENTDFAELVDTTAALIAPYVEKDPSKFYAYDDFEKGVTTLREFCMLREASVEGQLNGTIPATASGQRADASALVDADITLSDMGSMGGSRGAGGGNMENWPRRAPDSNMNERDFSEIQSPDHDIDIQANVEGMASPNRGEIPPFGQQIASGDEENADVGSAPQIPSEMQAPETFGEQLPGMVTGSNFPGTMQVGTSPAQNGNVLVLLGVSFGVMLAGLLIAFKFKQ